MPPDTFTEMINAVVKKDPVFTVGKVKTVNEAEMTCIVTPEDGGQDIEDVPLRIMRYPNAVGVTVVPVIETPAIVLWLGPRRPTIFRVQEWDKILILNKQGHGITVKSGVIILGVEKESEPAVLGDQLAQRISALEGAFNYHAHAGVTVGAGNTAGPSNTVTGEPEVRTWKTRLS